MRAGLYALVSLDEAPLQQVELDVLGLSAAMSGPHAFASGVAVAAVDPDANALGLLKTSAGITAFAGFLDEPEELAATLGLAAETPAVALALHALRRFGDEAPMRLVGEWSLFHFDLQGRVLTLLSSLAYRDPMHYAIYGQTVAISPDMLTLCRLPGVGRRIDPEGFALSVSRARLRAFMGSRTPWRGVIRVAQGTREIFSAGNRRSIPPAAEPPVTLFRGSFEDAVEASNDVCKRILQQQLRRCGRSAILLSGGLDSTLLNCVGAGVRSADAEMFALTSVAPAGSEIPDERDVSSRTSAFLGIEHRFVSPAPWVSAYIPSATTVNFMQEPMVGLRHYLYEALNAEVVQSGGRALLDGFNGEMSLTRKPARHSQAGWWKRWYRELRDWNALRTQQRVSAGDAFHVRLSAQLLHSLPREWGDLLDARPLAAPAPARGRPFGFNPSLGKMAMLETATAEGIRHVLPYRDMRLLRLAASFPGEFYERPGDTRPLARAMLRGRAPEAVRLNTVARPFSPDYELRIVSQAGDALAHVPGYRMAGVGEWLDLNWLDEALRKIRDHGLVGEHKEAQLACGAAEFLFLLNSGS